MGKQSVLLFFLLGLVFIGVSTQSNQKQSAGLKDRSIKKKTVEAKADKLLEWWTYLKNESTTYRDQGDLTKAIELLSKAIEKKWREPTNDEEHEKLAWIYTNRAYLYGGDYLAAKEDYLAALKQFEACKPSDYLVARYVYQPLGNIYTRLGENEIAISLLEKFKRSCEDNGEVSSLMSAYNDLGRAYLNTQQFDKAIALISEGISLNNNSDDFNLSLLYSTKAQAEEENGQFEQSSISAEKCIQHVNRVVSSKKVEEYQYNAALEYKIIALTAKAKVLGHDMKLNEAHKLYQEAVLLADEVYSEKHRARARALVELGNSYELLDQKVKALECYQLSLKAMVPSIKAKDIRVNPPKSEIYADVVFGEAFIQKGIIAHDLFKEKGGGLWLKMSVEAYLKYFEWVEIHRSEQFEFDTKLKTASEIHRNGEIALAALFDFCDNDRYRNWIDTAFVLMDQTKAIVLAEERGFKDLAKKNPNMRALLKEQNGLKFQRSQFKSDIEEAESEKKTDDLLRLKTRLSQLDERSQLLDQKIRSLFPSYRTQASSKLEGEVKEHLVDKLKRRDAKLLSYFVGEDAVYTISGSPGDFSFSRIERKSVTSAVDQFIVELNSPNISTAPIYGRSGKNLFDLLLGEKSKVLGKNWVIFPDGILNSIPFEALVTDTSKGLNSFKTMKYVVRDHIIHYSPSAFFYAHDDLGEKAEKAFLGIAPVFEHSKTHDFLPKSVEELQEGARRFSGDELIEEDATKGQFFRSAANYDILHISTHAGTNSGENNNAWMVFSDTKSSDNRLVATELLKLDLPASLVVLNACETGSGTVLKGEGPMSLARGFLDAGSQSTVTNLWRVNHESNALIMKSFYENLSETQSPSRSLKAAKLNYLSNGEIDEASAHPYYWSAAVLIGTDVSVNEPSSSIAHWIWISLGVVLALVLGVFWYRKKRIA